METDGKNQHVNTAEEEVTGVDSWDLLFKLSVSRRYSSKLELHFIKLNDSTTIFNLIGGCAVVADVYSIIPGAAIYGAAIYGAAIILGMSTLALFFDWAGKARHYGAQKWGYAMLMVRIYRIGDQLSEGEFRTLRGDMTALENKETPTMSALEAVCHNEECNVQSLPEHKVGIRPYQRWAACYINLPPVDWA